MPRNPRSAHCSVTACCRASRPCMNPDSPTGDAGTRCWRRLTARRPADVARTLRSEKSTMTGQDTSAVLRVAARDIPVPAHLSPEAQALLSTPAQTGESPAPDDHDGWRATVAARNEMVLTVLGPAAAKVDAEVEEVEIEGVAVYVITPPGTPADDGRAFLEIHGGALIMGNGDCCRAMGMTALARAGVRMWAVDYRMPPDHPYPASLDDCVTIYRSLLRNHRPEEIIVGGASAGGNL